MTADPTPPAAAPWLAEQLRLTAFAESGRLTPLARDWWKAVTGTPPEKIIEEPRTGVVQLQGTVGGKQLLMHADDRFDIRGLFVGPQGEPHARPLYADVLSPFLTLAVKWLKLKTCPPIQRLAFGAVVVLPFAEVENCRNALDGYLPSVDMQETELRDFMYQVNRRRSSNAISDLEVNRLMKWSVHSIRQVVLTAGGRITVGEPTHGSKLEVDINSDPDRVGSLEANDLVPLFREFVDLADQIMAEGDCP